ncbi:hypothetical protein EGJ50_11990 [Pseudomonas luteola]|nr:hypothetical protein EGJ50_11990 [Pseudomonas luteola]
MTSIGSRHMSTAVYSRQKRLAALHALQHMATNLSVFILLSDQAAGRPLSAADLILKATVHERY